MIADFDAGAASASSGGGGAGLVSRFAPGVLRAYRNLTPQQRGQLLANGLQTARLLANGGAQPAGGAVPTGGAAPVGGATPTLTGTPALRALG